jgi:predicted ABC-type ATPase
LLDIPNVVIIAGPNGVGKSTAAPALLPDRLQISRFVNADTIARGLSAFAPEAAAIAAGRIMLEQLDELARHRESFAFEATLSSRMFVSRLRTLRSAGYAIHLFYLWVPSPDLLLGRILSRVRLGGHDVPELDVRRRYKRSITNFLQLYRSLADTWEAYDSSQIRPQLVAFGDSQGEHIIDAVVWERLLQSARDPV